MKGLVESETHSPHSGFGAESTEKQQNLLLVHGWKRQIMIPRGIFIVSRNGFCPFVHKASEEVTFSVKISDLGRGKSSPPLAKTCAFASLEKSAQCGFQEMLE